MPNNDEVKELMKLIMEWNSLAGEEPPAHNQQLLERKPAKETIQLHSSSSSRAAGEESWSELMGLPRLPAWCSAS